MPYNGAGAFTRVYNWVADAAAAIPITAARVDGEDDGFATGLSTAICKDGQTTITADLPMSTFKHTGVGNASARTQYAVVGQIQDSIYNWVAGGGTANAITATYAPAVTVLVDGMELNFRATAANSTTTPTFAPNGLTAHTITKNGGSALAVGDIPGSLFEGVLRYNLANTRWELQNPAVSTAPFLDTNALIKGSSDATKLLRFEVDGLTTGTTRTLTPQDKNYTIADNADFAAKANLASPTFTGTPAAPTAASGTNTTQLATTAFAYGALTGGTTGTVTFSNGLIIKWGIVTGVTDGPTSQTINFAVAFPNNLYWVIAIPEFDSAAGSISGGYFNFDSQSTSGFTCTYRSDRRWLAIGN